MTTMRGNRRFSILLGVAVLATLPSCQRYITVAGRAEGFDQGGTVLAGEIAGALCGTRRFRTIPCEVSACGACEHTGGVRRWED